MTLYSVGMDFSVQDITDTPLTSPAELDAYARSHAVQYFWFCAPSLHTQDVARFCRGAGARAFLLLTPLERRLQYGDVHHADGRVQLATLPPCTAAGNNMHSPPLEPALVHCAGALVVSLGAAFGPPERTAVAELIPRHSLGARDLRHELCTRALAQSSAHAAQWAAQLPPPCQSPASPDSPASAVEPSPVFVALRATLARHAALSATAAETLASLERADRSTDDEYVPAVPETSPSVVYEGAEVELGMYLRLSRRKRIYGMTKQTAKLALGGAVLLLALRNVDVCRYAAVLLRAGLWLSFFCSITLLNVIVRVNEG